MSRFLSSGVRGPPSWATSTSICHDHASSLGQFLFIFFLLSLSFLCTISRPQSTTPRIACDSKSPMIDRLGLLVRPTFLVRCLLTHAHGPAPCGPITLSSMFPPFPLTRFAAALHSVLFYSVLFSSMTPLTSSCSIRFYLIPLYLFSLIFLTILRHARDLRISLYINRCTICRKP